MFNNDSVRELLIQKHGIKYVDYLYRMDREYGYPYPYFPSISNSSNNFLAYDPNAPYPQNATEPFLKHIPINNRWANLTLNNNEFDKLDNTYTLINYLNPKTAGFLYFETKTIRTIPKRFITKWMKWTLDTNLGERIGLLFYDNPTVIVDGQTNYYSLPQFLPMWYPSVGPNNVALGTFNLGLNFHSDKIANQTNSHQWYNYLPTEPISNTYISLASDGTFIWASITTDPNNPPTSWIKICQFSYIHKHENIDHFKIFVYYGGNYAIYGGNFQIKTYGIDTFV